MNELKRVDFKAIKEVTEFSVYELADGTRVRLRQVAVAAFQSAPDAEGNFQVNFGFHPVVEVIPAKAVEVAKPSEETKQSLAAFTPEGKAS